MKGRSSYTPAAKQIQINSIGTHNDNFLMSFVSMRESEKKRPPKSRRIKKTDEEAWFTELTNISSVGDLSESEIDAIINEFIPEYSTKQPELPTEKRVKSFAKAKTLDLAKDKSNSKLKQPKVIEKPVDIESAAKDEGEY